MQDSPSYISPIFSKYKKNSKIHMVDLKKSYKNYRNIISLTYWFFLRILILKKISLNPTNYLIFSRQDLNELLKKKNYESINLGVPSMPPDLQLCKYLLKLENKEINKADLILVTIYGGFGFDSISTKTTKDYQINYCKELNKKYTVVNGGYLAKKQDRIIDNLKIIIKNSAIVFYTSVFFLSNKNFIKKNNLHINNLVLPTDLILKAKEVEFAINNYINLVNENSAVEVIFIFIPESWDINNAYLSRWKLHNIDFINVQKSNKFIINYLSKKFNIIDTTKDLQTASKIKDTNYFFDTHFNQYGNMTVYNTFKNFYNKFIKE
jgi:hypothetical protein